jgi:hypothetical protein
VRRRPRRRAASASDLPVPARLNQCVLPQRAPAIGRPDQLPRGVARDASHVHLEPFLAQPAHQPRRTRHRAITTRSHPLWLVHALHQVGHHPEVPNCLHGHPRPHRHPGMHRVPTMLLHRLLVHLDALSIPKGLLLDRPAWLPRSSAARAARDSRWPRRSVRARQALPTASRVPMRPRRPPA